MVRNRLSVAGVVNSFRMSLNWTDIRVLTGMNQFGSHMGVVHATRCSQLVMRRSSVGIHTDSDNPLQVCDTRFSNLVWHGPIPPEQSRFELIF